MGKVKKKTKKKNDLPKLTPKQRAFVQAYSDPTNKKTYLNGTQSAMVAYNATNNVASSIATENLTKPVVKTSLELALSKAGLTDDVVTEIHKRNMLQTKSLSVSQQAVKDYYHLRGVTNKGKDTSKVNVAFIINES